MQDQFFQRLWDGLRLKKPVLPAFEDLPPNYRDMIEGAYQLGIHAAAEYVSGNWSTAKEMAEHLHEVADGNKQLYQE